MFGTIFIDNPNEFKFLAEGFSTEEEFTVEKEEKAIELLTFQMNEVEVIFISNSYSISEF